MTANKPEVNRYDYGYTDDGCGGNRYLGLIRRHNGKLVRYEDYQRLQADHERLQAECKELREADHIAEASKLVEAIPRWISVDDCMPGIDGCGTETFNVLVFSAENGVQQAFYCYEDDAWYGHDGEAITSELGDTDCVTHWMPLPEPPR